MCRCPIIVNSIDELCTNCRAGYLQYLDEANMMKKMIEISIPILAVNNEVIGTYSNRFNTRAEAKRIIFTLESQGMRFKDAFNEKYWQVVDVEDKELLQ